MNCDECKTNPYIKFGTGKNLFDLKKCANCEFLNWKNCQNVAEHGSPCKHTWWSTDTITRCARFDVDVPKDPPTVHGMGHFKSIFPANCNIGRYYIEKGFNK